MKLHQSSDPILQFLADFSNTRLVGQFLDAFGDRRNVELRRLRVRMEGVEAENAALRLGHLPPAAEALSDGDAVVVDGAVLTGQVVGIDHFYAVIKLADGAEHLIPIAEFIEDEQLGIEKGGFVNLVASAAGNGFSLSHRQFKELLRWVELEHAIDSGSSIEVLLQVLVKGGYSASYRGIPVFVPQNQIDFTHHRYVDNLLGSMIEVKLMELERRTSRVIASRKRAQEEARASLFARLREGDMIDGVVKKIADFGAFIDVGGMDALLHVSQMGALADTIEVGATIRTRVKHINHEDKKISLSAKLTQPNAWGQFLVQYAAGSDLDVKVLKLTQHGVIVEIMTGITELIFQSEFKLAYREGTPLPKAGDVIGVTIREIDTERKRIALRLRRQPEPRRTA